MENQIEGQGKGNSGNKSDKGVREACMYASIVCSVAQRTCMSRCDMSCGIG